MAALCEMYWPPVYAYIRHTGRDADTARDLTQAFFLRVLEKDVFSHARPDRGRFRSFLLTSVKNFLANEYHAATALRRGGGRQPLPLEVDTAERSYRIEPVEAATPERLYERRWALAVIGGALTALETRYRARGKSRLFSHLKPFLTGDQPDSYAALADATGQSEGAMRVAVHRARRQFARTLRDTVAETVAQPDEVDDELRHLLEAVSG